MNQIILKVKAIDWSYGNIGYVWILLDGGSCNIDWGDNHTSSIRVPPYSKSQYGSVIHTHTRGAVWHPLMNTIS